MTILSSLDWQTRAIAAYQWTRGKALDRLRDEAAARILRLTGHTVPREAIVVDRDAHHATLTLDGITFRLYRDTLVIVRPCAGCGTGQLESPPIADEVDLGYALGVWQPHCSRCPVRTLDELFAHESEIAAVYG